ncbi:Plasmid maintenance system killer [mine drainage metagenome]|uniref:Plasmid maintenance system killer n=2 Tax=mine drainage metagenome TaxID=410659 RepID=T0ZD78_9ZZZZ
MQAAHVAKLGHILAALDAAPAPVELNQPGYKLHPLKGKLKGRWSVWVNDNWRVTFRFVGPDVELVDYQDYH